jgi:hypothetical protein
MALCVREICPTAELYIARLDGSKTHDSKQKFTIASCVEASTSLLFGFTAL